VTGWTSENTPECIRGWNLARYTIVHSRNVAGLFVDRRPVDPIMFHHDLLGTDDPKSFFNVPEQAPGRRLGWQCSGA
jgi:hypothetical protein